MPPLSFLLPLFLACGEDASVQADDSGGTVGDGGGDASAVLARCDYVNPFSGGPECKEYQGAGWDLDQAAADCSVPVIGGEPGLLTEATACDRSGSIAECIVDGGEAAEVVVVFNGDDASDCSGAELGCTFAGGEFVPGEVCLDAADDGGVASEDAFVPFELLCQDPVAGEGPGQGPDGQVCTWQAISGCTEEGRAFQDYASCEVVRQQRPYYPMPVDELSKGDDPRLDDSAYMAELDWVTAQVEASACVCCHTRALAPSGPSGWYLEAGPLWVDSLDDDGLAMMAGWVDSTVFGAFPAEDNNGFHRDSTGMPTTDPERLRAFLEGELSRRGLSPQDFADTPPFGGPLYEQLVYDPGPCQEDQGVDADGTLRWTGGAARYLYVLDQDSMSPGVPPNLDLPEGTLWRLDVDHTAEPVKSGEVRYGETVDGSWQGFPEQGAPTALVSGETYYLVALLDIYQPATRCLFTAP